MLTGDSAPLRKRTQFTVLGGGGFVGSALVQALRAAGHPVHAVTRNMLEPLLGSSCDAGHVINCIGLTGDFRTRAADTIEAHVGVTQRCLSRLSFQSFLYVSSTRVYQRAQKTSEESPLPCLSSDPSDLYALSKLTGEALCLSDPRASVRVVRLSNVYGPGMSECTFLGQVLREGRRCRSVVFRQSPESCKDYVGIADVVWALPAITKFGRHRIYNLASGRNIRHAEIATALRRVGRWHTRFALDAPVLTFPPIDIGRFSTEFGPTLRHLLEELPKLLTDCQEV